MKLGKCAVGLVVGRALLLFPLYYSHDVYTLCLNRLDPVTFLSASLYFSKRGAY